MRLPPEFQDEDHDPNGRRGLAWAIVILCIVYAALFSFLIFR